MTFSTIPGMVQFGDLFSEMALRHPYDGPGLTGNEVPTDGKVRRSVFGVAHSDGSFELNEENPLAVYAVAHDLWQRKLCAFIFEILEEKGAHATLVVDRVNLSPKDVVIHTLRRVPCSRLQYGIFDTLDYRLAELRDYHGATILIPQDAATAVLNAIRAVAKPQGGAPEHPAKAWYQAQAFERRGRSMKELQRQMQAATGRAPSETAIREWERAAKS
jgi:hypothetical protein